MTARAGSLSQISLHSISGISVSMWKCSIRHYAMQVKTKVNLQGIVRQMKHPLIQLAAVRKYGIIEPVYFRGWFECCDF